jgi:hypothetical protein
MPQHDKLWSIYLPEAKLPKLELLQKEKVDLVLYNSHESYELPRALPPLVQSVGGLHIPKEVPKLPKVH